MHVVGQSHVLRGVHTCGGGVGWEILPVSQCAWLHRVSIITAQGFYYYCTLLVHRVLLLLHRVLLLLHRVSIFTAQGVYYYCTGCLLLLHRVSIITAHY